MNETEALRRVVTHGLVAALLLALAFVLVRWAQDTLDAQPEQTSRHVSTLVRQDEHVRAVVELLAGFAEGADEITEGEIRSIVQLGLVQLSIFDATAASLLEMGQQRIEIGQQRTDLAMLAVRVSQVLSLFSVLVLLSAVPTAFVMVRKSRSREHSQDDLTEAAARIDEIRGEIEADARRSADRAATAKESALRLEARAQEASQILSVTKDHARELERAMNPRPRRAFLFGAAIAGVVIGIASLILGVYGQFVD